MNIFDCVRLSSARSLLIWTHFANRRTMHSHAPRAEALNHERSRSTMIAPGSRISTSVVLLVGLLIGWAMASLRPAPLLAGAGDRLG
jgi:hypothetical protein